MKRVLMFAALVACAAGAFAQTCPFNIPVVTLLPHTANGYSWGGVVRPMNDACVSRIVIDPNNDAAWYVGGFNGLYQTKTNGATWTKPIAGNVNALLLVQNATVLVYAGVGNNVWLTRDNGATWTKILAFSRPVESLLVVGGTLFVGLAWNDHIALSGIYTSNLGGGGVAFHPFGAGYTGLIVWTLEYDDNTGAVYAGTEIYDHPQPYHPPFFRSLTFGSTWQVAAQLPWHAIDSDYSWFNGKLFVLTEGLGVYSSTNMGASWTAPLSSSGLGGTLLMDPKIQTRLFAGRQKAGTLNGGFFVSTNSGSSFVASGLSGVTVADIALNGSNNRVYAAAYASGIYTSALP